MSSLVPVPVNEDILGESKLAQFNRTLSQQFSILNSLLSSYFKSQVDGPSYSRSLKAISRELAIIKTKLESIADDKEFLFLRPEFLKQNLESVVFPKEAPEWDRTDVEYKIFLIQVISLYLQGSTAETIKSGVELITGGQVSVSEYISTRGLKNQFRFNIDVFLQSSGFAYVALTEKAVRILVDVLKPAHTIYSVNYILSESFADKIAKIETETDFEIKVWNSEYFRRSYSGMSGFDQLAVLVPISATNTQVQPK